jgi:hypothetical protein
MDHGQAYGHHMKPSKHIILHAAIHASIKNDLQSQYISVHCCRDILHPHGG